MSQKFQALKKAREEERHFPTGFWGADQPRCPHCGETCDISDNGWWRLYEEGEHEVSCPHCDEDFTVTTRVSHSFSTDEQEAMHEEPTPPTNTKEAHHGS